MITTAARLGANSVNMMGEQLFGYRFAPDLIKIVTMHSLKNSHRSLCGAIIEPIKREPVTARSGLQFAPCWCEKEKIALIKCAASNSSVTDKLTLNLSGSGV